MSENDKTRALISDAVKAFRRSSKAHRRHPAEVLSDKLGDFYSRYGSLLDSSELSKISDLRETCARIAAGD